VLLAATSLIALLLTAVVNEAVRYVVGLARESLGDLLPSYLAAAVEWGLAPAALLVAAAVVGHRTTRAAIRRDQPRVAGGQMPVAPPGVRGTLRGRPAPRLERT
jgi:uncharacterized protein (DUF2336 family)